MNYYKQSMIFKKIKLRSRNTLNYLLILFYRHALNVLKDDLIARLDQFSNEMVILKEEINSLQTVKACLQLRITELEEEAKKAREEYEKNLQKQEQDDVSCYFLFLIISISL